MNSLFNHYVALYFPEIERFFNSTRASWFCRFMLKFPTPASFTRHRQETFVKRAWDIVGRKVEKQRLLIDIYQTAQQSVSLPVPTDGIAIETFKLQLNRFYELDQQRAALEQRADSFLSSRHDYQHLKTIPGIGSIIALVIIGGSGEVPFRKDIGITAKAAPRYKSLAN